MLTRSDIENLLIVPETFEAVEKALRLIAEGRATHPDERIFHKYGAGLASIFAISASDSESNTMILKTLSVNWANPEVRSMPHMYGLIFLCELDSGRPKCVMEAVHLTNMRTGAVAGVAAKYLARKGSSCLGVIGSREIARYAALSIQHAIPSISSVKVYSRNRTNREKFAKALEAHVPSVESCDGVDDTVAEADIVVTATASEEPLLYEAMLRRRGVFVASLGSPREVDPFLLKGAKVVPETVTECAKRGKTGVAIKSGAISLEDVFSDLPSIVGGKSRGRTSDAERFLLDSIGLAEEDLCVANMILEKANNIGAGRQVDF